MLTYTFLTLLLVACQAPAAVNQPTPKPVAQKEFALQYQLDEPDKTFSLSKKLDEISGLSLHADGKQLVAIQDEDGLVFYLDSGSGDINTKFEFWKDGDYEGVEMVDDMVFVVKSSGTVYAIRYPGQENQEVTKYNEEFLSGQNDVEGITYDASKHRLLIACKGKAGDGDKYKLTKAIYSFDLKKMKFAEKPVYVISQDEVHEYLETSPTIRKLEKLQEFFTPDESTFGLSPSGLAIHPVSGDMYIISSVGKLLMILSPKGKIRHIEKLKKKVHAQPEGICFDSQGGLYISNEGKDGKAKLHYFSQQVK